MQKNDTGLYEAQVDNQTYEFEKWNAEESLNTLLDIAAILGSPLGTVVDHLRSESGFQKDLSQTTLNELVSRLSAQLVNNRPMVMDIFKKLAGHKLFCNGKKVVFKDHYADDLGHMFRVVRQNAEVQYGSFFGAVGAKAGPLLAQIKQAGPTPRKPESASALP